MAKQQVTVPDIGGAEGAEVIELLVAVGDAVEVDQGLCVLESDKASMEIPSSAAGVIVEILVAEGQELAEGAPVAVIDTGAEAEAEPAEPAPADTQPDAAPTAEPAAVPAAAPAATEVASEVVPVPDIGTDDAVELIEIAVSVGDDVSEGDSLVVLESDKASMEVPAPFAGEVVEIRVNEGDQVKQGDELVVLKGAQVVAAPASAPAPAQEEAPAESPAAPAPVAAAVPPATPAVAPAAGGSVYAGPAVRKLAREFGVPLGEVTGTGPRGRVLKEDLHSFVQQRLKAPAAASTSGGAGIPDIPEVDFGQFGEVETTARSKMDKVTASNMQRSWLNVPHVTQYDDADITDLEAFRASMKAEAERRGTKLTPMPFILKACAVALRDNPKFCSSLADGGESLVYKKYMHIGMAVDTPAGLVVPVIRDVDKKSIWELSEEVLAMAAKARDRKLRPVDMQGGCFTVSSLGGIGGTGFTPIVNAPEVGILGVSRADMKPVWNGSEFAPRKMLPLSLSYDHRVINGGDGGRFMSQLVSLLGDIRQIIM
ncbi:dihydrolipoyllysine-residue acetyltransferase [Halioglobus japonicus]|uniref:Acetyltransferase component of pyruvate dehydrogenase complex n=1 Tax=Halioglobus japonicus TaxID=930805 RepID=A0AAP8MF30_9GAMM|nr:dihydrolipoyllysine-residue acetyltransferase [Halioglobus japonicus]AQA18257.1 dihydrolipoyllysine-residue acetyltransferase [Halioglobus japonicus]PLW86269.1 dihydrolipoyllysine-residue acetyltransferase [Halioglobus japonicus]GHD13641.1 acetyltransferase component of pyruvate dehydrogenase complex [Halioglobus japonicus]